MTTMNIAMGLQISHAYFWFVSAFCFTFKHAETKLKQNNFTESETLFCVCFVSVLFQFYFRCRPNHCISATSSVDICQQGVIPHESM